MLLSRCTFYSNYKKNLLLQNELLNIKVKLAHITTSTVVLVDCELVCIH